ncbi:MAG: keto-hydroxyglutarate-aldolase/keto-deoxy-phosphogluconate aldolase, partial [Oscillospiraceae bacterium]|nr:keto-hydroxyglutarate-aldolase/keto-deoxy-phosphogluconate aldolase [Oscillospiraceae bacterium]
IKALAGPYTTLHFMPTGGVNAKNITTYLDYEKIVACGGTWMIDKAMIKEGNFAGIEKLTREAVNTMLGFRVRSCAAGAMSAIFGTEGRGTVVETNYMDRAVYHLKRRGVKFDENTAVYDGKKLVSMKICGSDVTLTAK